MTSQHDRRRSSPGRWALIPLLLLVAAAALAALRAGPAPSIEIASARPALGRQAHLTVRAGEPSRGLGEVTVELVQGGTSWPLQTRPHRPLSFWKFWGERAAHDTLEIEVPAELLRQLTAGTATVRVSAQRAGTLLRRPAPTVVTADFPVRLSPPVLSVLSSKTYVAQGGAEAVVYRVGEGTQRDGVEAGDWFFPGAPVPGRPGERFALFAIPYDLADVSKVRLVAEDDAANRSERSFIDQFFARPFGTDTISLDERFFEKVVPEILGQTPALSDRGSLLDNYLQINRDLRQANNTELRDLAAKTRGEFLWHGTFLPFPKGAVRSSFADRRTYLYDGRKVDQQDHLGFDLASTQQAPVPAANRGMVVLARYFGIYGNTVIVDHGFGLMTLYAHLSSIGVQAGQAVERGQELGRSGATGLAGGDHLHFTTLLHGLPVNPIEWWDEHWIRDRLASKLPSAGLL
jgi:murein DD-endopeptidase MepM/ murein hydrolase activator NlpD